MDLLEREDALAALAEAHASAAGGVGRVVVVGGEHGIGKSALVTAFRAQLGTDTKVLLGTCDDLSIARPLGPFSDLLGCVSASLDDAIVRGAPPQELHPLLIAELDTRARTTVLVLEDVHWADDATLDAVTFLARRIGTIQALLVLTLRTGEAPLDHPVHAALGEIPAANAVHLQLEPLSRTAVTALAGRDAADVFAATGGNPFYVTELLECEPDAVPASVAHAVLGRASRLDAESRRLVELVAVVPRRVDASLLDRMYPDWPYAAAEPERRHLLDVRARHVAFRHELVRAAVAESIPAAIRRRLHAEVLEALVATGASSADIVHHAEAAGAEDVLAEHALVAARRAAASHAHREAHAHYRRAVDFLARHPRDEQATILEEFGDIAYLVGRMGDAIERTEEAREIWRELGEEAAVGRCTRVLGRLHWFAGDGAAARREASDATTILERFGDSSELACAYASVAQLAMLAADAENARMWGGRALALAERLGDEGTKAHALVTLATVDAQADPANVVSLLEARASAEAAGSPQEAVRALGNLGYLLLTWGFPRAAEPYIEEAVAAAEEYELHHLASYERTTRAWLLLRAGKWDDAERIAAAESRRGASVSELLARTVLAELAVRRGDEDAARRLRELRARVERTGDTQRIVPVLDLEVERSLLVGAPAPVEQLRHVLELGGLHGRLGVRADAAAALIGMPGSGIAEPPDSPYSRVAEGDWRGAAELFGAAGWRYDRALMLTLTDDEDALVEALEIARGLGAAPLARRATTRLRDLGFRVPRGPYSATRTNPGGLTARQLQVLGLLASGHTNAEIADELVVSLRTAEHHVAAVLAKLGAGTRREAARRAGELGLALAS